MRASHSLNFELYSDHKNAAGARRALIHVCNSGERIIRSKRLDQLDALKRHFDGVQTIYSQAGAGDSEPRAVVAGFLADVAKEVDGIDDDAIYDQFRY